MTTTLVMATHNRHKLREWSALLAARCPSVTLRASGGLPPIEDGTSFTANALLKARAAATATGLPALADDSGLSVAILGGCPGIFSARWAGPDADDRQNRRLLLAQLADIPREHRSAMFVCAVALVVPASAPDEARETVATGEWPGQITLEERGGHGFGYDPVFEPEGYEITAAELDPARKDALSHRARALDAILPELERYLAGARS